MGKLQVEGWLYWLGWIATAAMALSIVGMAIQRRVEPGVIEGFRYLAQLKTASGRALASNSGAFLQTRPLSLCCGASPKGAVSDPACRNLGQRPAVEAQ